MGYPRAQRAIAEVIEEAMEKAGEKVGQSAPAPSEGGLPEGSPKPGDIEDGYRFKGGDPADRNSWEPVS